MNVWIRSVKFLELLLSKVCKIAIIFQRMFLRLLPFSLLCIYIFVHVFDHVHSTYVMSACLSLGLSVCIYVYVCTCGWLHACIYLRKRVYIFTLWFAHLNIYKFSYKCRFVLVLLTLVIAIIHRLSSIWALFVESCFHTFVCHIQIHILYSKNILWYCEDVHSEVSGSGWEINSKQVNDGLYLLLNFEIKLVMNMLPLDRRRRCCIPQLNPLMCVSMMSF